jgi:hypothetical protein
MAASLSMIDVKTGHTMINIAGKQPAVWLADFVAALVIFSSDTRQGIASITSHQNTRRDDVISNRIVITTPATLDAPSPAQ